MESFRKLGLSEHLIKVIEEAKFTEPSEIQERTIPLALAGKDLIGGSATGSGKTLAFGASIIEHALAGKGIHALILTPTRELAEQVGKVFKKFSAYKHLNIAIVYGGVGISPQIHALENAEIVVGTPGRILDHLQRGSLRLKGIKVLVLDEADRMLDMGFIEDVEKIIGQCPKERQTMLFSATISADVEHIAKKHMKSPQSIEVESYVKPELLKQVYYDVPKEQKFSLLVHLLKNEKAGLIMVFCNTRRNTDFVARNLQNSGVEAMAIHGGLSQDKRNKIMERFHTGRVYVLVCTDVAARGLDIKGVSHVYNYDAPPTSKEYIHRIGRTARAGKEGIAVSIVSQRDYDNFRNVLKDPELSIVQEKLPENIERARVRLFDESGSGRSFGRRGFGGHGEYKERRGFGHQKSYGSQRQHGSYGRHERHEGREHGGEHKRFGGERRFGRSEGDRGYSRGKGFGGSSGRSFGGDRGRSGGRSFGRRRY